MLITWLGPVCGAQLNPVVTLAAAWWERRGPASDRAERLGATALAAVVASQLVGGVLGTALVHVMFDVPGTTVLLTTSSTTAADQGCGWARSSPRPAWSC